MTSRHWMPFYVGDYLADTVHLSTEENGAYLLLIMHYWQHGSLPDDEDRLARIARLPMKRWLSIRSVLRPYFDEGWIHQRVESEIAKANDKFEKLSKAGKKGGRPCKIEKPSETQASPSLSQNEKRLESYSQSQPQDLRSKPIHEEDNPGVEGNDDGEGDADGLFTVVRGGRY